jgi:hypothetical protein
MQLDDSGNVSIHAIIQRMPVEEIAVILGSLGSINPMRAADMMKMLPISEAVCYFFMHEFQIYESCGQTCDFNRHGCNTAFFCFCLH